MILFCEHFIEEPVQFRNEEEDEEENELRKTLKLFNFGNLSSKAILKIFTRMFPQLYGNDKILNLNIEMTFYEFFEIFVACIQKSIRVKDEELQWKEKLSVSDDYGVPNTLSPTPAGVSKMHKNV